MRGGCRRPTLGDWHGRIEEAEALANALPLYERNGNRVAAERTRRLLVEVES